MADKLVESDLGELDSINHNDLAEQLKAEKITSDDNTNELAGEASVESTAPETPVPPKFEGKSVEDIVDSYSNLEKQYGRQGNELGELRKLADTLIQKNLQESQTNPEQDALPPLKEDDFLNDPVNSVRRIVEEALQPIKGALEQTSTESTIGRLQNKHPDLEQIVQDIDFQKWVMESLPRQEMWQKASTGDFNYADELLSQYKTLHGQHAAVQEQHVRTEKEKELQAATTVAGGSSSDAGQKSKTTYRRAELIRLQIEDPKRYLELSPEIYQAYSEGRVR
jgi:hypothetical protein